MAESLCSDSETAFICLCRKRCLDAFRVEAYACLESAFAVISIRNPIITFVGMIIADCYTVLCPRTQDGALRVSMKSQDILILLKLVSLQQLAKQAGNEAGLREQCSARSLEAALGVSKSEVNASINRSIEAGLALKDRKLAYPRANINALLEFISHGIKYVFPVKPAELARGQATAFDASVLKGVLQSSAEFKLVWPDPHGREMGQAIKPLFKTAPMAAEQDPQLYAYLALVDAIRLGNPREAKLAQQLLDQRLKV